MRVPRKLRLVLLGAVLVGVLAAAAGGASKPKFTATPLTPDSTFVGAKSTSGSLAQTDPSLLGRTDATPVNVLIKYDYDATASYAGGVSGLAATSPSVTGKKLKNNKDAVQAYERHTGKVSNDISAAVQTAVPSATIGETYQTAYGGVAAKVPANSVADLLKVAGVVAVQKDTLEQPLTSVTPAFIGATNVWPSLGGQDNAASGVVVGVIDTGIWPEHPSFADNGLPAPPVGPFGLAGCQFGDGTDVAHLGAPFTCNDKLIGAYAKMANYMANVGAGADEFCNNTTHQCSARDPEGHGTHTASTAAGNRVNSAPLYGTERGPISGMAPGARVIMYRVCAAQGCFGSDSVSAVQQAILDQVDVLNFSISGGGNPYTDAVELAFLDATHAGISVAASAGNSGPAAGTADHGGPWTTTVGASTSNRFFQSTLHLTADGGATFDATGYTISGGVSTATPVIMAASIPGETAICSIKLTTPAQIAAATGKVVACQRGTNARVDKGFNVYSGGAAGMILYNPIKQDVETDNHWLPSIHIDGPSAPFLAFVSGNTNVKAAWVNGVPTATQGDVMASFSSRGPQADFIKPDITAPGIQILAGMTPNPDQTTPTNGPPGKLYQAIAGTSMSSPHVAGASALVKAAHPDWTPAMIKSAIMTSSAQGVVKEDGVTPATPFDDGSGSLRVDAAVNPTLVFDESYSDFIASATDPLHRIDLNIASVDAPTMTGSITTMRTAINVSGKDQQLDVSIAQPASGTIYVSDKAPGKNGPKSDDKIHVKKNGTTTIWITISAPEAANGQYFGRITLDPKKNDTSPVTIPVAFNKKQGVVTLTHDCTPSTFPAKTGVAHCLASVANFSGSPANASLTVTNLDKGKGLDFTNISAPATSIKKDDGVVWNGTLTPAIPPQVTSITNITGSGPAGGYLPLSLFGIAPIAGVGDDTITNFNTPTFYYGGEPYSRIGVVSNGYVVLGGGTGADINFAPQTFPNPARPNNVVAPFWTDTNVPAGGAIRISTLTDGVTTWLVVDYAAVKNFSNATTHTGELWFRIGTAASSEQVTISYEAANAAAGDPGSGINSGAENREGTSGQNIAPAPANNTEYRPNLTGPTAGGSATITYDASSKKAGTYKTVASMTSDLTPGTTEVVKTLTVTP